MKKLLDLPEELVVKLKGKMPAVPFALLVRALLYYCANLPKGEVERIVKEYVS